MKAVLSSWPGSRRDAVAGTGTGAGKEQVSSCCCCCCGSCTSRCPTLALSGLLCRGTSPWNSPLSAVWMQSQILQLRLLLLQNVYRQPARWPVCQLPLLKKRQWSRADPLVCLQALEQQQSKARAAQPTPRAAAPSLPQYVPDCKQAQQQSWQLLQMHMRPALGCCSWLQGCMQTSLPASAGLRRRSQQSTHWKPPKGRWRSR